MMHSKRQGTNELEVVADLEASDRTIAKPAIRTDQSSADADQTAANSDQNVSAIDQSASDTDQAIASVDQMASDRDQAAADRQHAALPDPTDADVKDYEKSKRARAMVSLVRMENRIKRLRSGRDRDAAAGQRDRTADERDERGLARDKDS
jgi:hypothetical protein